VVSRVLRKMKKPIIKKEIRAITWSERSHAASDLLALPAAPCVSIEVTCDINTTPFYE
jgi:hypothetical protein